MLTQTIVEVAVSVSWLSSLVIGLSHAMAMIEDFTRFTDAQMTVQGCVGHQSDVAEIDYELDFDIALSIHKYFL